MSNAKPILSAAVAAAFLLSAPLVLAQSQPPATGTTNHTMSTDKGNTSQPHGAGSQTGQMIQPSPGSQPSSQPSMGQPMGKTSQMTHGKHHRKMTASNRPSGNSSAYERLNGETNADTAKLNAQEVNQLQKKG